MSTSASDRIRPAKVAVKLVIMTTNRQPEYIHQTLASLFMADEAVRELPVVIMVGSNDSSYLQHYIQHECLTIRTLEPSEWERIQAWSPHRRHAHNYHRCLTVPVSDCEGLCVCEDDVVFRDGFVAQLRATSLELERLRGNRNYALAGYAPHAFTTSAGSLSCRYPPEIFYGTQCMYFPSDIVPELAEIVSLRGVEVQEAPTDLVLQKVFRERDCVFACTPSIVQHIGQVSTGLGPFHWSPMF